MEQSFNFYPRGEMVRSKGQKESGELETTFERSQEAPAEVAIGEWTSSMSKDVLRSVKNGCTKKELQYVLLENYLKYVQVTGVKDGAKVIETIQKIAPAKEDVKETELGEPVSIVAYAESILMDAKSANNYRKAKTTRLMSSSEMLAMAEEKTLTAKIAEPFKPGNVVKYSKPNEFDAIEKMKESKEAGVRKKKASYEEYETGEVFKEENPDEEEIKKIEEAEDLEEAKEVTIEEQNGNDEVSTRDIRSEAIINNDPFSF